MFEGSRFAAKLGLVEVESLPSLGYAELELRGAARVEGDLAAQSFEALGSHRPTDAVARDRDPEGGFIGRSGGPCDLPNRDLPSVLVQEGQPSGDHVLKIAGRRSKDPEIIGEGDQAEAGVPIYGEAPILFSR